MDVATMLRAFCDAVERRDGAGFARLFCVDGVYHDVFYGAFAGRAAIAAMVDDRFHRDAADFRWDMRDAVRGGDLLYAHYLFSYRSLLPEAAGRRVAFEGVAMMRLRDGLIAEYREVADVGPAFVELGFAPERIAAIEARRGAALKARPEAARHLR